MVTPINGVLKYVSDISLCLQYQCIIEDFESNMLILHESVKKHIPSKNSILFIERLDPWLRQMDVIFYHYQYIRHLANHMPY
jgi:hypothetical protein